MERLGASLVSPLPGGKASGEVPGSHQLDRPGSQGVTPSDLAQVPAGEGNRVIDDDDQMFLATGVLLADLGVAPLDEQPTAAAGPERVG